eukprot:scaffold689_cov333-Pavlova_lutheri.AAC.8
MRQEAGVADELQHASGRGGGGRPDRPRPSCVRSGRAWTSCRILEDPRAGRVVQDRPEKEQARPRRTAEPRLRDTRPSARNGPVLHPPPASHAPASLRGGPSRPHASIPRSELRLKGRTFDWWSAARRLASPCHVCSCSPVRVPSIPPSPRTDIFSLVDRDVTIDIDDDPHLPRRPPRSSRCFPIRNLDTLTPASISMPIGIEMFIEISMSLELGMGTGSSFRVPLGTGSLQRRKAFRVRSHRMDGFEGRCHVDDVEGRDGDGEGRNAVLFAWWDDEDAKRDQQGVSEVVEVLQRKDMGPRGAEGGAERMDRRSGSLDAAEEEARSGRGRRRLPSGRKDKGRDGEHGVETHHRTKPAGRAAATPTGRE